MHGIFQHHIQKGKGLRRRCEKALDAAQLQASDIGYLNLHGTSTPQNDAMEIKAVQTVFSDAAVALSSTKHKNGALSKGSGCNRSLYLPAGFIRSILVAAASYR